ncbi:hypothetical protein [Ensifer sesbaniae]|uniref:hypothetical protein n=1 Tax=Ensifer sesbaniae TaxID=1214071 RepID=UPI00156A41DC|nr:hypothetical protein [Ensifer sesbaniae]
MSETSEYEARQPSAISGWYTSASLRGSSVGYPQEPEALPSGSSFLVFLVYVVAMIRIVQIACIAVTALVLFAFRESFLSLKAWFGPDFPIGFLCGAALVAILWAVNERFGASSGPGRTSKQD